MSAFFLFFLLNTLNYVDREAPTSVLPLIQKTFGASDAWLGLLGTAFMISYSITAIPFGIWSDRWKPQRVAAIGAGLWSLATMTSALAWSLPSLFVFRGFVGIGEAAFVATGSTVLAKIFSADRRARVLSWLNLGLPIGGALGVVLGGWLGAHFGWQVTFLIVGLPGLVLAYFTWRLPVDDMVTNQARNRIRLRDITALFRNPRYVLTVLGYAGLTYAFGAIVWFAPTYFVRTLHTTVVHASQLVGIIQVIAGLLGAPIGGYVADFWYRRNVRGRAYTVALAMAASGVFLWYGLAFHSLLGFLLSTFFLLWHVGVASTLIFDVTKLSVWNTAQAVSMLFMHLLGDVPSTYITGVISDHSNLTFALKLLVLPLLLASLCFFIVARLSKNIRHNQPISSLLSKN